VGSKKPPDYALAWESSRRLGLWCDQAHPNILPVVKEEQNPEKSRYLGYISCAFTPLFIIVYNLPNSHFGEGYATVLNRLGVLSLIALVGFLIGIVNMLKGIKGSSLMYQIASYIGLIINGIPALLGIGLFALIIFSL